MAATCSAIGISTPLARARLTNGPAVFTPSATMCMDPTTSSSERPWPSAKPTVRFRLFGLAHVATRSPTPARPPKVRTLPPSVTPRRPSSARPRVMSTARVLSPRLSPSEMPAAMAMTFFVAPAISHPTTSVPM